MVNENSINGLEGIHACELLLGLNSLRQKWDLCDVELRVGKTHIHAHRAVLSACSGYFSSMFTTDLSESRKRVIDMKGVEGNVLKMLVDFVYTGKVCVTPANVQTMLPAADLLQLVGVKEACEVFLVGQLHPSNALGIAKFAETYSCRKLHKQAREYVEEHFTGVAMTEEFLEQSVAGVCNLIESDNLNVASEKVVFNAVESWVRYDVANRHKHFAEILAHVRLPLLSIKLLTECMETNQLVYQDPSCRRLFKEVLNLWMDEEKRCSNEAVLAFRPRRQTKCLLAVGGKSGFFATLNSVEKFNPIEKKWLDVPPMKLSRYEFGVAVLEGKIYAVGGLVSGTGLHSGAPYSYCDNSVEAYCPKSNLWLRVPPLGQCRSNHCVTVLGGYLYVLGGYDGQGYLSSVECYSLKENRWTSVCAMRYSRSCFATVVLDECLYALGGYGPRYHCTVEKYDPGKDCWEMVPAMGTNRINFGAGTLHGYLYVIGGHDGIRHLRSVERFDPITNEWTIMSPLPRSTTGLSVAAFDGMLYALGGHDGSSYLNDMLCYDPCTDTWTSCTPMSASRCNFGLTAL